MTTPSAQTSTTAAGNKDLVRRVVAEFYNAKNLTAADQLYAADYRHHDPALPPEMQRGREAYKQIMHMFHTAFPDLHMTIDDLIAEEDKAVLRWTVRGRHQGDLMGMPPTGKTVTLTGIQTMRIAGGKVVEGWVNFDALGMMQQLGAVPAPEQTTA